MNGEDLFDGLVLDDDAVLDQHIDSKAGIDLNAFVLDRQQQFTIDFQSPS